PGILPAIGHLAPLRGGYVMKGVVVGAALLLSALCIATADGGAKKEKQIDLKCDMGYLEMTYGIKYKSHTVDQTGGKVKLLLEFTKDVENLQEMRRALTPPVFSGKTVEVQLYFHYFDEDNVLIYKIAADKLEGELSGKKGDAFRLIIPFTGDPIKHARKMEA